MIIPEKQNFITIAGKFSTIGIVDSELEINKRLYKIRFNLVDDLLPFDVIIGREFMAKNNMGVCFASNHVTINKRDVLPLLDYSTDNKVLQMSNLSSTPDRYFGKRDNSIGIVHSVSEKKAQKEKIELTDHKIINQCIKDAHTCLIGIHKGFFSTCKKIQQKFSIKNLIRRVSDYIKSCETCQSQKHHTNFFQKHKSRQSYFNKQYYSLNWNKKFDTPERSIFRTINVEPFRNFVKKNNYDNSIHSIKYFDGIDMNLSKLVN